MTAALFIVVLVFGAVSADQTVVSKLATSIFQAAAYDGPSGYCIGRVCDGKMVLQNMGSGDYVWYQDVDFGSVGTEAIEITFSSTLPLGSTGTVSVRLDSYNGPLLADITIGTTGNECNFYKLTTILKIVPTGIHTVYFTFNSPFSTNLMYFYLFTFIETIY